MCAAVAWAAALSGCTRSSPDYSTDVAQALVCQQYLACAAVAAPSTFPGLVPVYGPSGSCWKDASLAASCRQACQRSLDELAQSSTAAECGPRSSSADMGPPPPDLGPPLDLASPVDLSAPADLSALPDLSRRADMSAPSDLGCFPFGYQCNGDPTCCSHCCSGGCSMLGYCAAF
jgi:hypothetical protein